MPDETQATAADTPVTTADTVETQPSEASEQVSETPEATQETVAETTPTEVKAEDTVEEKLLAGKYKSVEDLEKSYKELESKFGKETSEKAELARILNESFSTPEATQVATATDDYVQDEPNPLNQEIESLKRNQAVTNFVMAHPEADSSSMQKVLAEDPMIKQISGHEAKLEYAYLRSQNMARPKAIAEAQNKAASETQAKIVEKQTAQVETARKSETVDEKSELMNRMSTGDIEQRDAARREYIRKYLV